MGSCLFPSHVSSFLLYLLRHGNGSDDFFLSAFFSVLCLTASSPKSFPPPGSSLSCLGPDSSSPRSPWPALASGPNSRKQVTLLPPFLSDQAQQVQALGTFYLFCQATGECPWLSPRSALATHCFPNCAWGSVVCAFSPIDPRINRQQCEAVSRATSGIIQHLTVEVQVLDLLSLLPAVP